MKCAYLIHATLLLVLTVAVASENHTVEKWEKAFEALRRRNYDLARKRFEVPPSRHKVKYSPYRDGYDGFESTKIAKDASKEESQEQQSSEKHYEPSHHSKETSHEERDIENHVSHPHQELHKEHDYSDEEYERDHLKFPERYPDKDEHHHPHSYSHSASDEIDSKPPGEPFRFRKPSRYSPPDLHSSAPLIPPVFRAHSPYYQPPFSPRIYLPYRPSHRYKEQTISPSKEKLPYGEMMQDIYPKHHYEPDLYEPSVKAKYRPYSKVSNPKHASSTYFVESHRSKIPRYQPHYSYLDHDRNYGSPHGYSDAPFAFPSEHHATPEDIERKPDPYYASEAYAKDKTFGVGPLAKDFTIPLNRSAERFSRPVSFIYHADKYIPPQSAKKQESFTPSFGPTGYPKEKYSPRVSYTASFDDSDSRFKYPISPYHISSKNERDPYLQSGSTAKEQPSFGLAEGGGFSSGQTFDGRGRLMSGMAGSMYAYSRGSSPGNKRNFPSAHINQTNQSNDTSKADSQNIKLPQPSESNSVLVLPHVHIEDRGRIPRCSLKENTTFCLHDTEYPYASITNAISENREKLESLLLEVPENETNNASEINYSSCQMRIRYGVLLRAVNTEGKWKILVKLPQNYDYRNYSQVVRLQECYSPGSPCNPSSANSGRCVQEHSRRTLLSWSREKGLHMDLFNLPSACVCHSEGYRYGQVNQINEQIQQKQRKHRIG